MKSIEFSRQRPFFLVFGSGDDVLETTREFAREHGIRGARLGAIGALQRGVIAYWNPESRAYERRSIDEQAEVASLSGDIALEGEELKVHAHVVLGLRDGSALAGHLLEGTVHPTLEMLLVDFGEPLVRKHDESTGLSLISHEEPR